MFYTLNFPAFVCATELVISKYRHFCQLLSNAVHLIHLHSALHRISRAITEHLRHQVRAVPTSPKERTNFFKMLRFQRTLVRMSTRLNVHPHPDTAPLNPQLELLHSEVCSLLHHHVTVAAGLWKVEQGRKKQFLMSKSKNKEI